MGLVSWLEGWIPDDLGDDERRRGRATLWMAVLLGPWAPVVGLLLGMQEAPGSGAAIAATGLVSIGVPFLVRTRDLSREGIYVHRVIEPDTPEGAHLALEFQLPGTDEVIWTEAESVHGEPERGIGLRFKDLSTRHARLLADFIEQSSGLEPVPIMADTMPMAAVG